METAQKAPARFAARSPKVSRATCIMSQTVHKQTTNCSSMIVIAEANESLPKTRNTAATRVGYPGAINAVGPVLIPNGEL